MSEDTSREAVKRRVSKAAAVRRPRQAKKARPSRPRDAAATRAALLSTAISEFAEKGFAGARVDEIANQAGVNKQLLYHHFGNKDDLYRIALETVYSEIREKERALDLGNLTPVEAMRTLVGYSFDYLAEHPEFIKLVSDENAQGAPHAAQSKELTEMHWPLVELLRETLVRGAKAGVFRDDMDPVNVYISIAGISYFYFSNNPTLSAIFGKTLNAPEAIALRRKHVIEFALAALRKN
ncbi:TetR/AcrR family transcriptional regulator [Microbaculum marinisediminis]|uniref:TetR family transcriptional regulator n=1 Tax=Microbaculum marinisediminis TaxID=2931392 RepID=A0AAW5QYY3_9HYPH|nr:TetR/AcrR family transcriptional regulator [Microbaculum sp. A6E488]MCT8972933.1 TetR family transcriptional regulator [Microbaculum sp. A6E488]